MKQKLTKQVRSQKSNKGKYETGIIYMPKEWIGKDVEIKEVDK